MWLKKLWFIIYFSCVILVLVFFLLGSWEVVFLISVRIVMYGGCSDVNKECFWVLFRLVFLLKIFYSRGIWVGVMFSEKWGLKF